MTETIFDKIIKREIPASVVYEDKHTLAFLDIMPFEKGHTLVIPKKHYKTIMDMPEQEYLELQKVVLKLAKHFREVLKCDVNIWQNNGHKAGQEIMHVHFHVVPRRENKKAYKSENNIKYLGNEMENFRKRLELK